MTKVNNGSADTLDPVQHCCKAGRVAEAHGITDFLDTTLANQWSAEEGPGLRTLAEKFNKQIVETALIKSGTPPLDGEVDVLYKELNENKDGPSTRVDRRLEANGIDPDSLRSEFVSYKTIDKHFKSCLGRERATSDPMTADEAIDRIRALNRRVEKVSAKTLSEAETEDEIGFKNIDASASVVISCRDCGTRKPFVEAIRTGCRCVNEQ